LVRKFCYNIFSKGVFSVSSAALGQALNLAKEIIIHPQQCLRVDRSSAYFAMYSAKTLSEALQFEGDQALTVITHVSMTAVKLIFKVSRDGE
jgi:hypothetical protein